MFYFDKTFNHAINVKLERDSSPQTGLVNFVIPVRVSMQNRQGEWKEFFRAINRSMQVLPRTPTIPRHQNAKPRMNFNFFTFAKLF